MSAQKLSISYDDVNSAQVDQRLARQEEATRSYQPAPPPPVPAKRSRGHGVLYNTAVYTALFGLIGGILGWACGEVPRRLMPNDKAAYEELLAAEELIHKAVAEEKLLPIQAKSALNRINKSGQDNPYYRIARSDATDAQKQESLATLEAQNARAEVVADIFFLAVAGMILATTLAIADAIVERNTRAAIINGSVGAALGLLGGVAAAFIQRGITSWTGASFGGIGLISREMVHHGLTWMVMGLFLAAGPGLVLRNPRKLAVGLLGGAIGGLLGGLLFDPVAGRFGHDISRLAAIGAIGGITGLAVGLIENVAKRGWLKVTGGLIAGKQFVLYRNPTFIGSALSCSIYLFRDPAVGPRHAAVHIVPGGFELEDLPLGTRTLVNGRPAVRQRLRDGDEIQIGGTTMVFHEKSQR
jgi:hypothetical protein